MVEITFKGNEFDVTIKGETISQIKEEYNKIKEELERELGNDLPTMTPQKKKIKREEKNKETVADKILLLEDEGFFDRPKTLIEIRKKLEEVGFYYPVTSFPPYLLKLCKERKLRRFKEKRDGKDFWVYVKSL